MKAEGHYTIHSTDFLNNPSLAGLPDDFAGMGVLRASENDSGRRSTLLVEHDYALLMLEARALGGATSTEGAVRWARLGWPEEWATGNLNPTWIRVYPGT